MEAKTIIQKLEERITKLEVRMDNIYKKIYPNTDWTYTYECPVCCEPVPLKPAKNAPDILEGYCQNCHLTISILKEDFIEWRKENEQ